MSYLEDRLYSEAFEDGVDYAIQRMFASNNWKRRKHRKGLRDARRWKSLHAGDGSNNIQASVENTTPTNIIPVNEKPANTPKNTNKTTSNKNSEKKPEGKQNNSNVEKEKGSVLGWVKNNPWKTAGIGTGLAAAGYGGHKLVTKWNEDSEDDID